MPREGIEPPTPASSGLRSTTELPRHCKLLRYNSKMFFFFQTDAIPGLDLGKGSFRKHRGALASLKLRRSGPTPSAVRFPTPLFTAKRPSTEGRFAIRRAAGNRTRSLRTRSACTTGILRPAFAKASAGKPATLLKPRLISPPYFTYTSAGKPAKAVKLTACLLKRT